MTPEDVVYRIVDVYDGPGLSGQAEQILADYRKAVLDELADQMERTDSRRFPGRGWDFQYAAAVRNYAHEDD